MATAHISPASSVSAPSLKLTRRGRLVVAGFALALVASLSIFGRGVGSAEAVDPTAARIVVVQPGQTLWSIARDLDPTADPRSVIEALKDVNDLKGQVVRPGQALTVPNLG